MPIMNPSPELFARLLPDVVEWQEWRDFGAKLSNGRLVWKSHKLPVVKTEHLHLCHLAEERLTENERENYRVLITPFSDWQQRLTALAQVKGVGL